jgi:hypothetical protein
MHTALISLVLMCGTCGDTPADTTNAVRPAVVSRELPADYVTTNLQQTEAAKRSNCGWQQR